MKIKVTKSDVIWNWIGIVVSLFSNFLMIPFLVVYLDSDTYGLWNVFVSLGSISVLFDFGFNAMFSRNVSYCWGGVDHLQKEGVVEVPEQGETNYLLLGKVIKTCQIIYLFISLMAFGGLATIGSYYIFVISKNMYSNIISIAWLTYCIGIFLNLFYGYYDAFLRGIGEIGKVNKNRTIAKLVQIIMTICLLITGFGIMGVSISYVLYGIVFCCLCKKAFFSKKEIEENIVVSKKIDKRDIKEIFFIVWHNAWKDGLVSIANYISNQVTTILCSLYLGLAVTGEFGLIVQLFSAVAQIAASIFNVYQPSLQEAYARRNIEYLRKKFSFSLMVYILLYIVGTAGIIVFIVPILKYIKPEMKFELVILLLISLYQAILKYRDCYACYLAGTNRLIYYKSFLVSAILCLVMAVALLDKFHLGIIGLALAQILSQIVYNIWYWPRLVDRELQLNFRNKVSYFINNLKELLLVCK